MNIKKSIKNVNNYYNFLVSLTKKHYFIGITNEWIVDNYYLLVEKNEHILHFLKNKKQNKYMYKNFDMPKMLRTILEKQNYKVDSNILVESIQNYCKENNIALIYPEIDIIPIVTIMLLYEKVSSICSVKKEQFKMKRRVDRNLKDIQKDLKRRKKIVLADYLPEDFNQTDINYFNERIKDLGDDSYDIFKQFNEWLEEKNISLRKSINKEHLENTQENIIISNIFYSIRKIDVIENEILVSALSPVEKMLNEDANYTNMTLETKHMYRQKIIAEARKKHENVNAYVKKIKRSNLDNTIFKEKKTHRRVVIYLFLVALFTILLALGLTPFFISVKWLGFIILLIPCSEIVITFLNKVYIRLYRTKPLPKIDFENGIPDNCKTMVVIPTIVKNTDKVEEVFNKLEAYYLGNKSENLFFALLGDACETKEETFINDDVICSYGLEKCKQLNAKYNKEIFHFAYRRRKFNKSENAYLGFERKRGALLHFNDLLLGKLKEKEKKNLFLVQTFDNFKHKIKYVITLDVDTQLVLNSALALVGTMAHPLNKPVLNKENTCVVKGYGIIQPKVSVDIEMTNQSLFSQIYAGIGGLDPYSSICPNFYQDVFYEGSFVGKGIYDLEVYQKVLKKALPNNIILSHDLLEGNYLRCGFAGDIELFDDFPSKFLVDATRRSRWARGDMQIIGWLWKKVRNEDGKLVKNPINLLGKWKIFDNIRRGLLDFSLLLILFCLPFCNVYPYWWLAFVLGIVILPVVSYIMQIFYVQDKNSKNLRYYNIMAFGYQAFVLRSISVFTSIPYNAYLYLNSFITALYRMLISKRHLLQWLTAEDAVKQTDTSFKNHVKQFWFNYVFVFLCIIVNLLYPTHIVENILIVLLFLIAPFVTYVISLDLKDKEVIYEEEYLHSIAYKTWQYFADNLTVENNYLIPDNYQTNRDKLQDYKTSPTDIGLSLVSIIGAYELNIITREKALYYISNIIDTIYKLDKWHGHLYNWYRINSLEVLYPRFISSVDSANFVASLITTKEFLNKIGEEELGKRINDLIQNTDFKVLYSDEDVFSIGYNVDEGVLLPFNYNKFASESRLISYVAIAKGDVPSKNWFNLDKTLTTYKHKKGLVSWSGTSFEYFMPLLFIPSYDNTLIDESYDFAYFAQKEFMKEINPKLPWGISESAYNELDDAQNYKYKAFSTPYLKLQEDNDNRIVISPYSSILALTKFPKDVINNMKMLQKLGLLDKYGFYESYDTYDKTPVYAYFAHHQGMILGSITNYLKNNAIQNYFMSDINNHAFEILSKEKVQLKPIIDLKITKYKRFSYEKEEFVNDIRAFRHLSTLPEFSVLSNSKYSVFMNDRGNGFSRYRTIQLNRYRKITEQNYGMFLYIKDLKNRNVWCNTYAPINKMPEKYEVVFALDRMKFIRLDDEIITTTEIAVSRTHHAEIRKITFKNTSDIDRKLELTTYTEPIICENMDDISHRSFQSLFVKGEYIKEADAIVMSRKLRDKDIKYYLVNRLLIMNPDGKYSFETDRANFIGRNHTGANPVALNKALSNKIGNCIDPIISIRNRITIKPNAEKTVYFINGFGKSKEQVLDILKTYNNPTNIEEKAFEISTIMSNVTNKLVNITGKDMRLYNTMLNYLYQTSHISINDVRREILKANKLNQTSLWRFGISGDRPIVFASIKTLNRLNIIKELLHAFEYYKSKSIFIDLIILNSEDENEKDIIAKEIENEKYHMYAINSFHKTPGNIYIIDPNDTNEDEITLFKMTSRLFIDCDEYYSLEEFVNELQKLNTISRSENKIRELCLDTDVNAEDLEFYNGYGGFSEDGKSYIITNQNTPVIWSNIITNPNFGSIVSNNQTGFTFAKNSREYKLTSWTCDALLADLSEGFKFNDIVLSFNKNKIEFGRSTWIGKWQNLDIEVRQFVALEKPIKFYRFKIKNNNNKIENLNIKYWLNPCLGVTEEKTSRYILCNFNQEENILTLQNKYSMHFSNMTTFVSSTLPINSANISRILSKEIDTNVIIEPGEEKEFAFMLGALENENIGSLVNNYRSLEQINEEENKVITYWQKELNTIQIKTPVKSFDYILNGWLAYQTISSRLFSKAGFYQVGGAYGFRDQLQDAMNICLINPDLTRKQILWNAKHQFKEGDVLHWWHKDNMFGLRSSYKDDYLWLIFATYRYLKITDDYSILDCEVPFVESEQLKPHEIEKGVTFTYSNDFTSLYEHCNLALNKALNELGSNGLPLMGGGDWNDGMNKVGEKGSGTSVWLGFFLCIIIDYFVEITNKYNKNIDVTHLLASKKALQDNLRKHAWDGEYYLRAFFDNGDKLGSNENTECKIDLLSQSFAILSNVATKEEIASILDAIDTNLLDLENRIVRLLTPAFKESKNNPGYIMDYPQGIRENGGQYTHSVGWYIEALIKTNNYDKAFYIYQMINPILRTDTKEKADQYKLEPYVISADIYSNDDFKARGGWNWYTGSAGWFYYVGIVDMIGFNKVGDKLYINPHLPKEWSNYEINYTYRETNYHIVVDLKGKENTIKIDGKKQKSNYIKLKNDKKLHEVIVTIGGIK